MLSPRISTADQWSFLIPSFWDFVEASLLSDDGLNHQPLATVSTPEVRGTASSNPLITWLAPWVTNHCASVGSKSHLISIAKGTFMLSVCRIFREF